MPELNADNVADLEADDFEEEPVEETGKARFEANGIEFEVVYTKKRLDLYEQRHTPIMASFIKNDGALSHAELTSMLAYGLRSVGGSYVNPAKGMEMADRLIDANGYGAIFETVFEALQRDCGFLFK